MKGALVFFIASLAVAQAAKTYYLEPGEIIEHRSQDERFQIYCYRGKPKYIIHMWQTITLQIDLKNDNYNIYDGPTSEYVEQEYLAQHYSWSFNVFSWKQKRFRLNPFNQSCLGVYSPEQYKVHLNVVRIDYWKVLCLLAGVLLYFYAHRLSGNTAFYYLSGISIGIAASFLILIYFVSKLFPGKTLMYGSLITGYAVAVYLFQMVWENIRTILFSYQTYVIWYAAFTGTISFIVCYRMGPVTNKRTLNLVRWCLQAAALALIYISSEFQEAAVGQMVILIIVYSFPKKWLTISKTYWRKRFPPKAKLLSNDEYYQQGVQETTKALEQLRDYCSSPKCNQWKTVLKLKDSKRFASFMEGESHLSDDEILEYESSIQQTEFTDDEDYTEEEN